MTDTSATTVDRAGTIETAVQRARTEAMATMVESGFTMDGLSEVFVQSGFFKDVKAKSQAIVKILLGRELGLKPIQAMLSINMVQGRPEVAAATLGALVKRSGRYDYRVKVHTHEECEIEFFSIASDGKRESIGVSRFDMDDAKRARLAEKENYKLWPKNMVFARSMSNGVKWYCLEAIGGMPVYVEGEVAEIAPATDEAPPDEYGGMEPKEQASTVVTPNASADGVVESRPESAESGSATTPSEPAPSSPQEATPAMTVPDPACVFELNGVSYQTKGITKDLLLETFKLVPQVNKRYGKKYAENLLKTEFGCASRKDLTEENAQKYIVRLNELLEAE